MTVWKFSGFRLAITTVPFGATPLQSKEFNFYYYKLYINIYMQPKMLYIFRDIETDRKKLQHYVLYSKQTAGVARKEAEQVSLQQNFVTCIHFISSGLHNSGSDQIAAEMGPELYYRTPLHT